MECEMCGSGNANTVAQVEGVRMNVCQNCSQHGTVVKRAPPPVKKRRKTFQAPPPPQEESELIESVRPETPKLLQQYRERTGLSLHDFAQKLNIKASVYQHYESGNRLPSIPTARVLEKEIGTTLVVQIKIKKGSYGKTESSGLTFADFFKKR